MTCVERSFGHDAAAPSVAGLASGALAVAAATFLLELSRTLAERARGRWYAGNGRDVFHAGAVAVLTAALAFNGLPPAIASAPVVVDPRSIETAVDAVARALFRSP